jgi:hypothetical protein
MSKVFRRAPVHAANASGNEDFDAGQGGTIHRASHCRGAEPAGQHGRQVATADLVHLVRAADQFQIVVQKADVDSPTDQRENCGLGAQVRYQGLHFARSANVLRTRDAVGNDGRFQRHQRAAGGMRSG